MPPAPKKSRSEDDNNVIRFHVKNVSKLGKENDTENSEDKVIGNFPWNMSVRITGGRLDVDLFCHKEDHSNVWFCEASCEFSLINIKDPAKTVKSKTKTRVFSWTNCLFGIDWNDLKIANVVDPKMGFIKNDAIVIEGRIKVLSRSGDQFRKKPELNFDTPSNNSNTVLKVGDEEFHVCKEVLAIQSPKFQIFFFSDDKKIIMEIEAKFKETDSLAFECFLRMLYRGGEPFSEEIVTEVLELADFFQVQGIMDDAEKQLQLMDFDKKIFEKELFLLTDKYRLYHLQHHLLGKLTKECIKNLKKSEGYAELGDYTKNLLFERFLKLDSEEEEDEDSV